MSTQSSPAYKLGRAATPRRLLCVLIAGIVSALQPWIVASADESDSRLLRLTQGKHDDGRTITIDRLVACSPERAFKLWSTDKGVRTFFAPASRIGRDAGDEYTILFSPVNDPQGLSHGTKGARILASSPGSSWPSSGSLLPAILRSGRTARRSPHGKFATSLPCRRGSIAGLLFL